MASSSLVTRRARLDDHLALLGQAARGPVDQLHVELPLEAGHVRRHVGLDRPDGERGGREAPGVGDSEECLQMFQLQTASPAESACPSCTARSD